MNISHYINTLSDTQLIFGPAFIILGAISVFIHIRKSRVIKASLNWPTTIGVILHSYYFRASSSHETSHADIGYYYVVNGDKYESSRISIIDEYPDKELLDKFKKGNKVEVYYDPEHPERSVLIPGGNFNFYVNLFIVILPLFVVGIGVFVFG